MSVHDKIALHQIIVAFFLQNHKEKKLEILNRAHLQLENLERDIESLSIYGVSGMMSISFQQEQLVQSKFLANSFSNILGDIQTQDVSLVGSAIERVRSMLDIVCYSTQRFELVEMQEHVRRVFDLVLSSNLFELFGQVLDQQDDMKVSPIKLDVLRIVALMSVGCRLFT